MSEPDSPQSRKTVAYVLVAIAGALILAEAGLFGFSGLRDLIGTLFRLAFNSIPYLLVLAGIFWITRSNKGGAPLMAWLVIIFGAVLIVSQIGLFGLSFSELFVPLILVTVAFFLVNPRNLLPRSLNTANEDLDPDQQEIKLFAFMGGGELNFHSKRLKGGEVMAIWGGYEIDFSDADMEGDSMQLHVYCVMGGVEIKVPANWNVEKSGALCIMGGFSNKTRNMAEELNLPSKTLVVTGLALMGGGEIRN
ncbi:MAG: LiaF-related protein [Gammaproteobacteria bacterium]|nr:LiaF-related protein [Gammaproteobacteria bacterium]MDE0479685.1 LiaF-related protein [Gammaproteobacteria bacterium]MYE99989.1 hypothetical protein [Gammaproteobacteria bacterium]